jgi:predicted short-subunit dehydrogenase-like oxidoreductase (DUF2520 family)
MEIAGASVADPARNSAARLAGELGAVAVEMANISSAGQSFILVAVPDGALDSVASSLSRRPQAAVAWHTAGSRDASALEALRRGGSAVGSLHPLRAFPAPQPEPSPDTFFAIDGDPAALALAGRLVEAWHGRAGEVPPDSRRLYHLAASMAAGGVVTLLAAANSIALRLGLPEGVGEGYRQLAAGAIAAIPRGGDPAGSVTGPVARGDGALLTRQLDELLRLDAELAPLVARLGLETLRQIERLQPLDERQSLLREELRKRFIP